MSHSSFGPDAAGAALIARIAGSLYIVIAVAAVFAHFIVPDALVVVGAPATTRVQIAAGAGMFRGGIAAEMFLLMLEVILSVLLYRLLAPVNRTLALLAMVSRLIMAAVHGANLINHLAVLVLSGGTVVDVALPAAQMDGLVALFLKAHSLGFTIGIAFLTIHVFAMGVLIYRSGYFPRILGVLFLLAGVGYLLDSAALLLLPSYTTTPVYLAVPITVAEIAFPLWLLIRGLNRSRWPSPQGA